ncbi:nitrogen regulation protein NR(II) [Roseovarius sp. SCSIO 43702]|uniref:two-component system sensor histidine kinase NtrB n=1 Tax=Roseovarius sp. SCSIO 43702 TaxID=2823043 RepID=UPI002175ED27|nr:ATP-binding protein [Roseovarius sp. SCSIO 43702]
MNPGDASLWAAIPSPVLVIDADDRVCAANPAAEMFFNISARSLSGRPLWDVLRLDHPPRAAVARARVQKATLVLNDAEIAAGQRETVPATIQIAPHDQEGAGHMLVFVVPHEGAGRSGSVRTIRSHARSAIGMAEMLAHEIKNPLAGITGAAQLLAMSLGPEDRELTDLIVEESRRVAALLEQVEQFGDVRMVIPEAVNLHDVLERAKQSARLGVAGAMRFVNDYDPSLPAAAGSADQLIQVILNLVKNAAEAAGPGGGTITLRSYYDGGMRVRGADGTPVAAPLQIEVEDDGPGLPDDIVEDAFDPFVSGRENGTGLGLALVAKIVAAHGGMIGVETRPGRTVFRMSLRAAARDRVEAA